MGVGRYGQGARYTIERSADARNFNAAGSVAGHNTNAYTYNDVQAPVGTAYYRLHLQDAEGEDRYSKYHQFRRQRLSNKLKPVLMAYLKDIRTL